MPFEAPNSVDPAANVSSILAEDFAAAMAALDATDLANQEDGLAACREVFRTLPTIRRGDSLLIAHFDADRTFGQEEECMWEIAEAAPGQPVKQAEGMDEMRWGTLGEMYFEAALLADGAGADLLALFQAVREIVSGEA